MKAFIYLFAGTALILGLAGCQAAGVESVATPDPAAELAQHEATLRAVVMEWAEATNDQDLERNLAMVTDDFQRVVIGDPIFHGEVNGKAEFGATLKDEIALHMRVEFPGGTAGMQVVGDMVTTSTRFGLDPFRAVGVEWIYGTDEITINDGKISRHVFTISEVSAAELGAAFAAQEQSEAPAKPDAARAVAAQRAFYAQQMASEAALERWSAPVREQPLPAAEQPAPRVLNGAQFE